VEAGIEPAAGAERVAAADELEPHKVSLSVNEVAQNVPSLLTQHWLTMSPGGMAKGSTQRQGNDRWQRKDATART
jgi:hypothetical protein